MKTKLKKASIKPSVEYPFKIIETGSRDILNEGRQNQMGFAFLKDLGKNKFKTLNAISPCKDYLNDVVYSEQTGKNCSAYGLTTNKENIFNGVEAYLAVKICPNLNGTPYQGQDEDTKNLNENFKKMEEFINHFEEKLKLDIKTIVNKVSDNLFHVKISNYWVQYTYLISLWSLLLRCGQFYKDGDKDKFLSTFSKLNDSYNVANTIPKLNRLIDGELPKQNWENFYGGVDVHNTGIVSFKF